MFKILTVLGGLFVAAAQIAVPAAAQDFPSKKPIKIVVAANAGGLTDVLGRITAEFLQKNLGQAVVVENKPGAASVIGADYTAKSPADGYTIYLAGAELAVIPALRNDLPYNFEDFTYLTRFWTNVPLMVVGPDVALNSPKELIEFMKANPGKLRYGTPGVGSLNHIGTAMFEGATGVEGVHVPYTGTGPVYNDLLAGVIDFTLGASLPFPDTLKVLGPTGTKRHPAYPDLPTLEELGYNNASHDAWFGFLAPPNLPQPIADRLIAELTKVFKDPEAIEKYRAATKGVPDAEPLTGEDFKKLTIELNTEWKAVAEREKIVLE
jgi:tripartite-type tricarboxylate transporter receptor subunit TctC